MKSVEDNDITQEKSSNSETESDIKPEDPVEKKLLKIEERIQKKRIMKNKHDEINL